MIKKLCYEDGSPLHRLLGYNFVPFKNLTILMGPNGIGKSSILRSIEYQVIGDTHIGHYKTCGKESRLEQEGEVQLVTYYSRQDNGKYRGYFEDTSLDLKCLFSSEGQSNIISFSKKLSETIESAKQSPEKTTLLLLDELDSGLSLENVMKIVDILKKITEKFTNIQVVATAHSFEFAYSLPEHIFWVFAGDYKEFSSYDEYRKAYVEVEMIKKIASAKL